MFRDGAPELTVIVNSFIRRFSRKAGRRAGRENGESDRWWDCHGAELQGTWIYVDNLFPGLSSLPLMFNQLHMVGSVLTVLGKYSFPITGCRSAPFTVVRLLLLFIGEC